MTMTKEVVYTTTTKPKDERERDTSVYGQGKMGLTDHHQGNGGTAECQSSFPKTPPEFPNSINVCSEIGQIWEMPCVTRQ